MERTVLDHVAIGTRNLTDGWELFGGLLGGTWRFGGDSPGFWWGELNFAAGPAIELLSPTDPDGFLERFLARSGAGPHHLTFLVPDIEAVLARMQAMGLEPVGVQVSDPHWKEAFLHPKTAHGIVIQVAQQAGSGPMDAPPADLPDPGEPSAFAMVEHHVADLDGAVALFEQLLDATVARSDVRTAELTWENGASVRLVRSATEPIGALGALHFRRTAGPFGPGEADRVQNLSKRLGISVQVS